MRPVLFLPYCSLLACQNVSFAGNVLKMVDSITALGASSVPGRKQAKTFHAGVPDRWCYAHVYRMLLGSWRANRAAAAPL